MAAREDVAPASTEVLKLGFDRIVFFSDGVLAIAVTLLVLEIRLPETEATTNQEVTNAILTMVPAIAAYLLSFSVVGTYWILHHRLFKLIVDYDYRLISLNLMFLFGAAFVPVTTAVLSRYADFTAAPIFYALGTAFFGISEFFVWAYAVRTKRLVRDDLPRSFVRYTSLRILVPPAIFLLSIPIAALNANLAEMSWALMIPAFLILRLLYPHDHELRAQV
ncbi:MAG: TMEM175 family protein [Anaerolineae bacterium]